MMKSSSLATGYADTYRFFDSPLMRSIRSEAYGEDIGQHSWITGQELRGYIRDLGLTSLHQVLDFGCGPCGPLTFMAKEVGCKITGVDLSSSALAVGTTRANELCVSDLVTLKESDGNLRLPVEGPFDVIVSFDVILHLQDRKEVIMGFLPLLTAGGKLLLTDAGVITGPISNEEIALRSINGFTKFVPSGYNEQVLESCGFTILSVEDQTAGVLRNAEGRLRARLNHRHELLKVEGEDIFQQQQDYLETVVSLSERKVLSRRAYLAELKTR